MTEANISADFIFFRGSLIVRAEPVASTRDVFVANFSGHKLKNTDGFFGKSDPFLVFHRFVRLF